MSGYRLSADAEFDLSEIWEFIARDSVDAADRWIDRLFDAFDLLGQSPGAGHKRQDLTAAAVRFWSVGKYVVIYREHENEAQILAVTQGGRDVPALLRRRI